MECLLTGAVLDAVQMENRLNAGVVCRRQRKVHQDDRLLAIQFLMSPTSSYINTPYSYLDSRDEAHSHERSKQLYPPSSSVPHDGAIFSQLIKHDELLGWQNPPKRRT